MTSTACCRLNEWLRDAQAMEHQAIAMLEAMADRSSDLRRHPLSQFATVGDASEHQGKKHGIAAQDQEPSKARGDHRGDTSCVLLLRIVI